MKRKGKMNLLMCYCFHICTNKKLFNSYKSCINVDVVMTNASKSKVISKMYDGAIQTVGDVRFILDLRKKLILFVIPLFFFTKNEHMR